MNIDEVKSLNQKAAQEKWSFPQIFEALKKAGVERYETNVLDHEIKYVGGGTSFIEGAPSGFVRLKASSSFNSNAVKLAITRIAKGETNYTQFLAEIAGAGVAFYRVDMKPRTVTYHGSGRNKLVENVPAV